MSARIDHLVIAVHTLEQGVAWFEALFGAPLQPGGQHALMSTHNRLLRIGPFCYLEVIAIDPSAPSPGRARWFGLDDPAVQARLEQSPELLHWVMQVPNASAAVENSQRLGFEDPQSPSRVVQASRAQFTWQMTVTDDGMPRLHGLVPTFIQWGDDRPVNHMPMSPVQLEQLTLEMPRSDLLRHTELMVDLNIEQEPLQCEESNDYAMTARFTSPNGVVELDGLRTPAPAAPSLIKKLFTARRAE